MFAARRISDMLWTRQLATTMSSHLLKLLVDTSRRRWIVSARTCTTGRAENGQNGKETDQESREFEADELPVRTIYYGPDGVESFTMDSNSRLDESFDWETFEREAGILNEDFGRACPVFANLGEFPDDLDEFEASIDLDQGTMNTSFGQNETRKARRGGNVVGRDPQAPKGGAGLKEQSKVAQVPRSSASWAPNMPSSKLNSGTKSPFSEGSGEYSKRVFAPLPKHPKNIDKPGMQRRLAMLESEMERIVTEVMCRCPDWTETGMEVDAVGLSRNMQDLTVFYSSVGASFGQSGSDGATGNGLSDKEMQKRVKAAEVSVRRAIASGMDLKYAPNIHFQGVAEQSTTGAGQRADLDDIFDRIAKEQV
jgi:ribosome-binding factor A